MKNRLSRNWGLKIGSFLFAAILWLIVTNVNDPVGTFKVYNVPVKIQNADLITNNGQVYEVLDNTDVIDTVTISAKRSIIDSLDESNVVAVADMNDLTSLNTISIRLSTNKYNDKLESIEGSIDSVKLNIEDKRTKTLQLKTDTVGEVKDGYMVGEISTEQNLVEISGPESLVSQVKKAVVSVDVSGFTNNIGTDSVIRLYDENDKLIASNSIVKNISKVRVNVEILKLKTVSLNWNLSGTASSGYEPTGEITATRSTIVIAGKAKVIDNISSIDIPDTALDITGASENVEIIVDVEDYLPDGVILAEEDFNGKVMVTVSVEPTIEKTVTLKTEDIQIVNMPEGFEGKILENEDNYEIVLVGLEANLNELDLKAIQATVDIAAWMQQEGMEELSEDYYTIGLTFNLDENISLKEDVSVRLHITEKEE
ncbi:MAG: CdaR family protein [Lachnospiraceae bacterium]|nr:CdaR family protein [Lachnospiraceae bacterium]